MRAGSRAHRWIVGVLVLVVSAVQMAPADGQPATATADDPAGAVLRGEDAVRSMGDDVEAIAARHDMSAERLTEIFRTDPTARLDRNGRVYFEDVFENLGTFEPRPQLSAAKTFDPADAFTLHSRPGAKRVIYLDFNGQKVTNTTWNAIPGFMSTRLAFSLDGNRSSFSVAERKLIHEVWLRVSENYAPFAIDVTTEQPTKDEIDRSGPKDQYYGTRALISPSRIPAGSFSDPVCNGCAGIAYLGVFDDFVQHSYFQPAIILSDMANDRAFEIAEVVTHEVGHNLGLSHDGGGGWGEYHLGYGNWGPIMGAAYTPLSQWSDGSYRGSSNKEDDLSVIASHGGTPVTDDHGDTVGTATASGPYASLNRTGVISTRTDVDAFSFTVGADATVVSIAVDPVDDGPDLDVRAVLRRADGTGVIADDGPGMSACLTTTLDTGTYTVLVDGVGRGNPFATRQYGYTDYGSLGQFTVHAVSGCARGPRFLGQFSAVGTGDPGFSSPSGIAVAPGGDLYVADISLGIVQRFSRGGSYKATLSDPTMLTPTGVAVASDGTVFVSDRSGSPIHVFDADGTHQTSIGSSAPAGLNSPEGVAIDPSNGDVVVADTSNSRVVRFTPAGLYVSSFGSPGSGDGQFSIVQGIAVDGSGNVYAADVRYDGEGIPPVTRLQKFSSAGVFQWSRVLAVPALGSSEPLGVAVGSDGVVYVADIWGSSIQAVTAGGSIIGTWTSIGDADWNPSDIASDSDGNLWVIDISGHLVQRFTVRFAEMAAPTVTITSPKNGAIVAIGSKLTLAYSCSDPAGGSGMDSCRGPVASGSVLDTVQPGKRVISVVAVDRDGNTTTAQRTITVEAPKPDLRIRAKGSKKWIGDDDYTGSQGAQVSAPPGKSAVCELSLQNDARVPDRLGAGTSTSAASGYKVTIRRSDGTDVTSAFSNGTFRTKRLAPGDDERLKVTVKIRASPVPSTAGFISFYVSSTAAETGADFGYCSIFPN